VARAWLVAIAFTVSGFTSLVLEVVWSKALALLLGSTLYAVSTVVATYLGGLALGAWLAGRLAERVRRPLRLYGFLEMGVGAYALLSLFLIRATDPLAGALYAGLGATSVAYLAARVLLAGALLVVPTVLMGATLPTLVSWAAHERSGWERGLGLLYGLNTLGAVAGAACAGFALVPRLGLASTTYLVGALALLVGITMAAIGGAREPAPRREHEAATPATNPWPAILFGLSGAVALVFEITWTRVFGLVFGSSVYSFALVLSTYLLGLAIGSLALGGRLATSKDPWRAFGLLQAGVAAGATLGLWLLPSLPKMFLTALFAEREHLGALYFLLALVSATITLLPCIAFGALFPVGVRLVAGESERTSAARATGAAYAANTAGTLTGTLLAGFVLLPHLGVHATWVGAALLSLALGAAALRPKPALAAGFVALALAGVFAPAWSKALFTLGSYRSAVLFHSGITTSAAAIEDLEHKESENKLLFYKEGLHGVVSVHETPGDPPTRSLRVNGKSDASTAGDMATQVFLGHLPMLWARPRADVCVIGQGSGVTVRAALAHDPRQVTVVELEPAVIEASHFFDAWSDTVLADPRVHVVLEDGRQHLQHAGRSYDVIVSEPSNPWVAGTNNLFTVDFYRRVRAALRPGGVFCQWIQAYEISPQALGSLFRSYAQVFPAAEVFFVNFDFIIVAPPPGARLTAATLDAASPYLSRFHLEGKGEAAGSYLAPLAALVERFPEAPLNTDDRPFVEYRAPFDLYQPPALEDLWSTVPVHPVSDLARWVQAGDVDSVAYEAGLHSCRMARWVRAQRIAQELRARGGSASGLANQVAALETRGQEIARVATLVDEASRALERGDQATLRATLGQALELDPGHPAANLLAARVATQAGALDAARHYLAVALRAASPDDRAEAYVNLGMIEMREGHTAAGRGAFESARALAPAEPLPYVYLSRWQAAAGHADSARAVLAEGLAAARLKQPIEDEMAALAKGATH
jgi:spermidine synthase